MIRELIAELQADETGELARDLIQALFPNGISLSMYQYTPDYWSERESTGLRVDIALGPLETYDTITL